MEHAGKMLLTVKTDEVIDGLCIGAIMRLSAALKTLLDDGRVWDVRSGTALLTPIARPVVHYLAEQMQMCELINSSTAKEEDIHTLLETANEFLLFFPDIESRRK